MAEAAVASVKTRAASKAVVWRWSGKTKSGESRAGEMEAGDSTAVEARLRQMGIEPTRVRKKPKEIHLTLPGIGGVGQKDILVFTRQFSVMIDAGLPLVQALDIIGTQSDNPTFRKVILGVKTRVESGSTFADALAEHPKVFDELFVQLVRAGEIGGILDTILQRLGAYIEKNEKLKRRVKGAMTYPIIVLLVAVGVVGALIGFVVPTFEKMFKDMGGSLPAPTQFLVDLSKSFRSTWYWWLALPVVFVVAFRMLTRKGRGQQIWHDTILKMPLFGPLVRKVSVARFTRTLGTMISSGVPILDALEIVAKSAGNKTIERAVLYVRAKISEGKNIASPLAETKVFPPMVVQMIGVGEATGAMDQMLGKIADFYDDEVDVAVASLTSMLEPLMMVVLGGIVGFFMIAMYLPIFNLASVVK
ncbi:MAG TPA: type II secretion system F family protein [Anaeromyxobacter sp.]|nr:type II secretion system F family protein [Anaeromyxobacter sp.]